MDTARGTRVRRPCLSLSSLPAVLCVLCASFSLCFTAVPACTEPPLLERASRATVVLTGTVRELRPVGRATPAWQVQVWRIMKGLDVLGVDNPFDKASSVLIHSTPSRAQICDAKAHVGDTRIFFLEFDATSSLQLSSSLVRISLRNLQNVEKAIVDHKRYFVTPEPPSLQHLCMGHSCSYGAVCERDAKEPHRAICVCHRSSCPTHARPVCGHNGLTYKNECHLRMEECSLQRRIRILSQGPCDSTPTPASPMVAPTHFKDLDFCDGMRCHYGAHCIAGKCECPECEVSSGDPVCGNDSVTYSSECELKRSACQMQLSLTVTYTGPCDDCMEGSGNEEGNERNDDCWMERCHRFGGRWDVDAEDGPCLCLFSCSEVSRNPVCGSDGIMYTGECDLRYMRCKTQKNITVSARKSCKDASCNCNEHGSLSNTCDPHTGKCPCRKGVGGQNCDRCDPGFWGFRSLASGDDSCAPCQCNPLGSVRIDCNQMNGKCTCLEGIQGHHCDVCPDGRNLQHGGCQADAAHLTCEGMQCDPGAVCVLSAGKPTCKCNRQCNETYPIPVCGSDNMTYKSHCHLLVSACSGVDVTMVHVGSCTGQLHITQPKTIPLH